MSSDTHQGMGLGGGGKDGDGIDGNAPHGDHMGESPSVEILTFPSGGFQQIEEYLLRRTPPGQSHLPRAC